MEHQLVSFGLSNLEVIHLKPWFLVKRLIEYELQQLYLFLELQPKVNDFSIGQDELQRLTPRAPHPRLTHRISLIHGASFLS